MTIMVGLILLGIPIATGIAERWDGSKRDVWRMADRDRARQRKTLPQRRMRYARIGGKIKVPVGAGNSCKGQRTNDTMRIARIGGYVK